MPNLPTRTLHMSDFLRKFKSVFIIGEEVQVNTQRHPAAEKTPTPPPSAPSVSATSSAQVEAGSVNNRFVQVLAAALERNNQAGFDYFEFRQSLINLAKMPMDEQTRFHSAFAMAQTMGATSEKLIISAQFYLGVLNTEQDHFSEAHAQQMNKLVGERQQEKQQLEAEIQKKSELMAQLSREIEQHKQQRDQIEQDIASNTVKIESTKSDFEVTFASVVNQIKTDMAKIQQYLS